jgi:Magnesium chelatase, subunit ChlI
MHGPPTPVVVLAPCGQRLTVDQGGRGMADVPGAARNVSMRTVRAPVFVRPAGVRSPRRAWRATPTILSAMRLAEALETTRMHRVVGLTGARTAFVMPRPFRAPHHTISDLGLIGGEVPLPGDGS